MLNVTRAWNAVTAVGLMRRCIALAGDYATRRQAFGMEIMMQPAHLMTLSRLEVEARGNMQLVFSLASLMGRSECNVSTVEEELVLRLMTPVAKLYTAKHAVWIASEAMEAIGGVAYCEDSGFPTLLRDAQVLPIWEGTTNVMSLDVLRAVTKSKGEALGAISSMIEKKVATVIEGKHVAALMTAVDSVRAAISRLIDFIKMGTQRPR